MIHGIRTEKGSELLVAGELIRHGLDVYAPLVNDWSIDLIVRIESRRGVAYYEVEVKTASGYDRILGVRNPDTPRGFDILVFHRRLQGQADEIFYLTAEQVAKHRTAGSKFRDLSLSAEDLEEYKAQTLERLATALRAGTLPTRSSSSAAEPSTTLPVSALDIQRMAGVHTARHLGDAIGVGQPRFQDGEWHVELRAPGEFASLGELILDESGRVIEGRSATYESVRERFNAQGAETVAA